MKALPIALLLLTALPSLARLGETKAQCEARYGTPVGTTKAGNTRYLKGGLEIVIIYSHDKASTLYFAKPKPGATDLDITISTNKDKRPELTQAEQDTLLQANTGTSTWQSKTGDPFGDPVWRRADGKAVAYYAAAKLEISDKASTDTDTLAAGHQPAPAPTSDDFPRLRETKAQLEKRCGPPIKTISDTRLVYRKSGYTITATFWKGKAGEYVFQSEKTATDPFAEEDKAIVPAAMPGTDIDTALKANIGSAKKWDEQEDDSDEGLTEKRWNRGDQKVFAVYRHKDATLTLSDYEYLDYRIAQLKQELAVEYKDLAIFGQTKADCQKRLGEPATTLDDGRLVYHKAGIAVFTTFWKERAAKLVLIRADADDIDAATEADTRIPILHLDREALLQVNSDGSKWTETEDSAGDLKKTTWVREDLQAIAVYDNDEKTLTIHAQDYIKHLQQDLKEKEEEKDTKNLDGF